MNEPSENRDAATDAHLLKPRLAALLNNLRESAAKEKQNAGNAVEAHLTEICKQRGEVFEQCAQALENIIGAREHAIGAAQLKPFHPDPPAKTARRLFRFRRRNKSQTDSLVDLIVILVFLAVIAGCAYFIIRMITRWNIKGLG